VSKYCTLNSGFLHAMRRHRLQSFPPVQDIAVMGALGDNCCCSTIVWCKLFDSMLFSKDRAALVEGGGLWIVPGRFCMAVNIIITHV